MLLKAGRDVLYTALLNALKWIIKPTGHPPSLDQVVLAPVVLGAFLNQSFPKTVSRAAKFTPCIATLLIALIGGGSLNVS